MDFVYRVRSVYGLSDESSTSPRTYYGSQWNMNHEKCLTFIVSSGVVETRWLTGLFSVAAPSVVPPPLHTTRRAVIFTVDQAHALMRIEQTALCHGAIIVSASAM